MKAESTATCPSPELDNLCINTIRILASLIQAQRDYFGSHTYERIDARGTPQTQWENK